MFQHAINPVFLKLGFVEVRYYSLAYLLGLAFAYIMLRAAVKRRSIHGLNSKNLDDLVFYIAVGLIAGARILYFVFYSPATFIQDPLEIFKLWHGGMSFHGGLVGITLSVWLFARKKQMRFYKLADLLVMPAALALFFGRIANFINGELIGTPTRLPFCIQYSHAEGCRHPSQLYEAFKNLAIFFVLAALKHKRKLKEGTLFWLFVLLYGSLRFAITFLRDEQRFLGLSMGQYLSLAMVAAAIIYFYRNTSASR
jgi:phosphatidylglycerol:prolipoprotein diacylglycerol transferase